MANSGGLTASSSSTLLKGIAPMWSSIRKKGGKALAVVGAVSVFSSAAVAYTRLQAAKADKTLPDEFVLEMDLDKLTIVDSFTLSPLAFLQGNVNQVELPKVVKALKRAGSDPRVKGLLAYLGRREAVAGLASVQELRQAISNFRTAAGSRAVSVAYSNSFGEGGANSTVTYLLASAFEKVYMQPTGLLSAPGLESQALFVRGLLDKLKVRPIFFAKGQYKAAANQITQTGFTEHHKENLEAIIGSMSRQIMADIAKGRNLDESIVQKAMDDSPSLPGPSLELNLLDGLKYKHEVLDLFQLSPEGRAKAKAKAATWKPKKQNKKDDPRMPRIPLSRYILMQELKEGSETAAKAGWMSGTPFAGLQAMWRGELMETAAQPASSALDPAPASGKSGLPKIAVVMAVGPIVQGPVVPGPGNAGSLQIDAHKLTRQLEALWGDQDVKAVVLRVNSPGGSAVASDTIYQQLLRLKADGKKIIVSMGDVAASGGYFMAAAADKVVAQPGTITGSIGVITGKFDISSAVREIGVNPDSIKSHENVDMLSPFSGISPKQEEKVQALMDNIYEDFLQKVAIGRHLSVDAVRPLAGGRVYTGEEALSIGLVDQLGGLEDAVAAAKVAAGLPPEDDKSLVVEHPLRKVPLLLRLIKASGMAPGGAANSGEADTAIDYASCSSNGAELAQALVGGLAAMSHVMGGGSSAGLNGSCSGSGAGVGGGVLGALVAAAAVGGGGGEAGRLRGAVAAVAQQALVLGAGGVQCYSIEAELLSRN